MYKIGNGIKNGELMVKNADVVFASNTQDLNFVIYVISKISKDFPEYILNFEKFYNMDLNHILYKLNIAKSDLRKIKKDFGEMVEQINKFAGRGRLILQKTNESMLPKLNAVTIEILKDGTLDQIVQFLINYIDRSNKRNEINVSEIVKLWDSISRKKFEGDISDMRRDSIQFIKKGLLHVSTKENRIDPNGRN